MGKRCDRWRYAPLAEGWTQNWWRIWNHWLSNSHWFLWPDRFEESFFCHIKMNSLDFSRPKSMNSYVEKRAYSEKGRTHRLIAKAISPRTRPKCDFALFSAKNPSVSWQYWRSHSGALLVDQITHEFENPFFSPMMLSSMPKKVDGWLERTTTSRWSSQSGSWLFGATFLRGGQAQ